MAAGILAAPGIMPARDRNGRAVVARIRVYQDGTTTPQPVYTSVALSAAHAQPIVSDDAGRFPLIWIDEAEGPVTLAWETDDGQARSYDGLTASTSADTALVDDANAALAAIQEIAGGATDLVDYVAAAGTSATAAGASQTAAAASSTAAAASATSAASSATAAASSASGASTSASTATTKASEAGTSATGAAASATNAASSATNAAASAATATTQATSAASSASAASTSAGGASTSATNAATSASSASGSAATASTAATTAGAAQTAAETARDIARTYAGPLIFAFDSATSDADPGAGELRLNHATLASATAAYVDNLEQGGATVSGIVDSWDDNNTTADRGTVTFREGATGKIGVYKTTGSSVDGTGYRKVTLVWIDGSTGGFTAGNLIGVAFERTGNKGADGAGAGDVLGPASATDGGFAKFDGTSGKLLKNSAAVIAVADGGTGAATLASHGVLIGNGTSAVGVTAAGTAGHVLTSNGASADPTFQAASGGVTGPVSSVVGQRALWNSTSGAAISAGIYDTALTDFFGDGSDGNVTVSGVVTLTRDMLYNNLTISAGAAISTAGFLIRVAGTLDITASPAGWLTRGNSHGNNGSGSTGGTSAAAVPVGISTSTASPGTSFLGGAGGTTTGTAGSNNSPTRILGGPNGAGGAGGSAGGAGGTASTYYIDSQFKIQPYVSGHTGGVLVTQLVGATLSPSGGGGGGSGGLAGGGGGGGAPSQGVIGLFARTINRGGSTAAAGIVCTGNNGGNGAAGPNSNTGGGGGSSGCGGGYIYIVHGGLTGSTATNLCDVTAGNGGTGGNGNGTGAGGVGGDAGGGGRVFIGNVLTGAFTISSATAVVAGSAASGSTGGAGGTALTTRVSL